DQLRPAAGRVMGAAAKAMPSADRELTITRMFDAPRALVFKAWTDPGQVKSWWGPRDYPAMHLEMDVRPGGAWRGCLRSDETGKAQGKQRPSRELTFTRIFDAPRALVLGMWTDPKHVAQWWGPRGFTNPVCEMDVRPGGALRIVMRAPDGTEYPMPGIFRDVVAPERLV